MQKLTFTIDLTPIELRGMSATLFGMAAQIERNLDTEESATYAGIDNNDVEFLGSFPFGENGESMDVFSNTPLLFEHINALPVEAFEKYEGETIEKSAADAFSNNMDNGECSATTDVELDADGIPWDARIHGASKAKLARGNTWKLKRGVDKDLATTVVAELKALMSAPAATTEATTVAPDNVTNIADAKPAGPGPASPAKPAAPAAEIKYVTDDGEWTREQLKGAMYTDEAIDALPIAGQTAATETTFPELMQLVTPALAANTITDEQVTAACVKHGVASIALIAARPDLIPAVKIELFG